LKLRLKRPILLRTVNKMETQTASREWANKIRAQYRALKADEYHLHNNVMHQSILETWKRDSPVMWANLSRRMLTVPLAYVLQARMWDRKDELMQAGLPMTDARELAEKETLMLEPEEVQEPDDPEDRLQTE
jgi:hypothetical protein